MPNYQTQKRIADGLAKLAEIAPAVHALYYARLHTDNGHAILEKWDRRNMLAIDAAVQQINNMIAAD